ncbi:tripartite tricarboxylate transporter TctB family protein [Roseibium sp. Sym1]|uniref:tripartite tricarboxylate transporter TctB family protein n=1 Tax=Roseibium sp. Sym1 TaxID=3016006 RepID=UPI0022B57AFE|nr:tripartite tricarboxylate transporter TctB family protein [Roseibium sp. Sym1]
MKVNDAISGGFFVLFAALVFYLTRDFRVMPGQNYGAAFFPRTIAGAMAVLGLVMVFQGVRNRGTEPWATAFDWIGSPRLVANFLLIVGILVFYILLSDWLGFPIAGFVCIFSMLMWLRGPGHWLGSLALSIAVVVALQYAFGEVLRVPLPWGLLQDYRW